MFFIIEFHKYGGFTVDMKADHIFFRLWFVTIGFLAHTMTDLLNRHAQKAVAASHLSLVTKVIDDLFVDLKEYDPALPQAVESAMAKGVQRRLKEMAESFQKTA